MRRLVASIAALLLLGSPALAQIPMTGAGKGAPGGGGGGGGFTGPLDVVAGATVCYSFRACSAALRGTRAVKVCNVGDAACADLSTNASTGDLVVTTIGGSDCTVVTCTILTLYDQTVSNACASASCDLSQATIASRPTFVVNCVGGKPCAQTTGAASSLIFSNNNFPSISQIYSQSVVTRRTASFTTQQGVFFMSSGGAGGDIEFANVINTLLMYAGTVGTATAADSGWHAVEAIFNGASSNLAIDGSSNTVNAGAGAVGGNHVLLGSSGATSLTGNIAEAIFWPSNITANISALNTNQHTYWGF